MSQIDDKYLKLLRSRYRRASKKEKTAILDEYLLNILGERDHLGR